MKNSRMAVAILYCVATTMMLGISGFSLANPINDFGDDAPPIERSKTPPSSEGDKLPSTSQVEFSSKGTDAVDSTNAYTGIDWMRLMAQKINNTSFELVFVVTSQGNDVMPYVWRRARTPEGRFIEQLRVLNGPGFEQIAYNNKLSIFEPGHPPYSIQGAAIRGPIPNAFIRTPDLLEKGYDIIPMGRNRISGRMAKQIRVVSKDQTRFGYHLWLDETSGVLLKLNTYNLSGRLIEQMQVTQLNISDEIGQVFENFQESHMPDINPVLSHSQRKLAWDISFVPVGMEIVKKTLHRIGGTGQLTEYMLLSDGVVDVSVYLLNTNSHLENDVSGISGSNAVVVKSDGRVQVTVLGKIPLATAERIANSIVLVGAN
ncbi:MucB/RseB C-terminal domain-containing protein [Agaribacter flavus]|uniref:MucB/RseB C-terminal domain-containing protein n=1 Tax=Agaribacter flavus TaxID=1902781 RepID=A0ABV7FP74_9ALTE